MFFIDWLFPARCLNCNLVGHWLCIACQAKFNCSLKLQPYLGTVTGLDHVYIANHDHTLILARILYGWKYKLWSEPGKILQNIFANAFCTIFATTENIICVPVPVHKKKLYKRGFNQARLLTHQLELLSNLQVLELLLRTRNTRSQVGLSKQERCQNIKSAFMINPLLSRQVPFNTRIVLVDDILTSGSTLQECALLLRKVGFSHVDALVLHQGTK